MRELPIIFSTPMVQAILDGRKSMTRRVCHLNTDNFDWDKNDKNYGPFLQDKYGDSINVKEFCPYQPGDHLWVRETTWISECKRYIAQGLEREHSSKLDIVNLETGKRYIWQHGRSDYAPADAMVLSWSWQGRHLRNGRQTEEFDVGFADVDTAVKIIPLSGNIILKKYNAQFRNKLSSRFMPKAAARIWLEVTDVRVERLQEITEEDAIREGFKAECVSMGDGKFEDVTEYEWSARDEFCMLWGHLNEKRGYGWDTNPWVWVISFKRIKP